MRCEIWVFTLLAVQSVSAFEDRVESVRTRLVVRSAEGALVYDRVFDGALTSAAPQQGLATAQRSLPGSRPVAVGESWELLDEYGSVRRYRFTTTYELIGSGTMPGSEQVRYFNQTEESRASIRVNNVGNEQMCVSLYVFTADEELVGCCTCPVSPGRPMELGIREEGRRMNPNVTLSNSVMARLRASVPVSGSCMSAHLSERVEPATGMVAWAAPAVGGLAPFSPGRLSTEARQRLAASCVRTAPNGTAMGICLSCAGSWDGGRL